MKKEIEASSRWQNLAEALQQMLIIPRSPTPVPIPRQLPTLLDPSAPLLVPNPPDDGLSGIALSERSLQQNSQSTNALNTQEAFKKVRLSWKRHPVQTIIG